MKVSDDQNTVTSDGGVECVFVADVDAHCYGCVLDNVYHTEDCNRLCQATYRTDNMNGNFQLKEVTGEG